MSDPCQLELVLVVGNDRQILTRVPLPSADDFQNGLNQANMSVTEWFQKVVGSVIEVAQYSHTEERPSIGHDG